jgi:DNA-directed RNA polymerase specialized sigma24 family protein
MKRDRFVDFFYVAPHQAEIHKRLENWAQWSHSPGGAASSPMFRLYRPDNYEREMSAIPVDSHDAHKIAKGVAMLPSSHRQALSWNYIVGGSPRKAREKLGVTLDGLMLLISDARVMLINRGI